MIRRRLDWEMALAREIAAARNKCFRWGVFDCALFAADCALAMTGEDLAAPFRGRYESEEGADQALGRRGHATLELYVTGRLGPPVAPSFARRGDAVLVASNTLGPALAIVGLSGTEIHLAAQKGLADLPLRLASKAWRVG